MSIDVLKTEVESLPGDERRKLMAFMVALEDKGRADYAAELARKIDDKSPGRWLTLEECEQKLAEPDDVE
jgi:hypothetical protein